MLNSNRPDSGPGGFVPSIVSGVVLLLCVSEASAYVGPSLGVGAIGVVLGILGL